MRHLVDKRDDDARIRTDRVEFASVTQQTLDVEMNDLLERVMREDEFESQNVVYSNTQ